MPSLVLLTEINNLTGVVVDDVAVEVRSCRVKVMVGWTSAIEETVVLNELINDCWADGVERGRLLTGNY
jgi:hypothetical protein